MLKSEKKTTVIETPANKPVKSIKEEKINVMKDHNKKTRIIIDV